MSRKKLCVLQPDNVPMFRMAAVSNDLPILQEEDVLNSNEEPCVAIWIEFNYTTLATEIVIPAYQALRKQFDIVFKNSPEGSMA